MRILPTTCLILASSIATVSAELYTSTDSGFWETYTTSIWSPEGAPLTGSTDSVNILTGHTVEFSGATGVGLPGSNDMGVANGQSININGGVLTQTPTGWWVRIGHQTDGTLNINDGRFHITNGSATNGANLQIGIRGAKGVVNIGDGIGEAGSAVLNLRDLVDGTLNSAAFSMNLAATEGNFVSGASGTIVINKDGLLEGDVREVLGEAPNTTLYDPVIRVGQGTSSAQSSITINAGGQFNAHGKVEIGAEIGSNGLIRINGTDARMVQDGGEFNVAWHGTGSLIVENGGVYSRLNNVPERQDTRQDILIGREARGVGSVTVQSGGQFLRDIGDNVGDLRIGYSGTGSMTINDGGLVENNSNNWDWIGQENGSNGTLTINAGGTFRTTSNSNFIIGVNTGSTGLVVVNGGSLELQSGGFGEMRIGQNGNGTFRQISGTSDVRHVQMAESSGTATFDLQGGVFNIRANLFLGGASNTSQGTGTATFTQSGGDLSVGAAFVVGLAPSHTGTFTATGGTITHTGSDISVGESGIGTMHLGVNSTLTDTSDGQLFVGRNEGSRGTLIVDGTLTRTATNDIRVGNGDSNGVDNTTAPGVLGGTGSIVLGDPESITGGVRIGAHGTLTGGTLETVGTLSLTGNLSFSSGGVLFANFGSNGQSDRISLTGSANITDAVLDGDWLGGTADLASRFWLLVNDDVDSITGTFANASLTSPNSSLFPDAGGWVSIGGQEFAVFYNADFESKALTGGNDLMLAPIPEPSTSLLLGSGLALSFARRRRKSA